MAGEVCMEHALFGGSISTSFPRRFQVQKKPFFLKTISLEFLILFGPIEFQDVSDIREVPDHQVAPKLELFSGVFFNLYLTLQ